jgi:hypothetical protein
VKSSYCPVRKETMSSSERPISQTPREPKRIAVIAVHGVGEHPPGSSARQISDLLANLESSYAAACPMAKQLAPSYTAFDEEPIAVAVQPVTLVPGRRPRWVGIAGPFEAIAKDFAKTSSSSPSTPIDEQDHVFMRAQLQHYKIQNAEKTYRTIRMRGIRRLGSSQHESRVDVYELYWKDLSSLGLGVATIFGELYQILFHLTSLGCQAVRGTWIENPTVRSWAVFATLQKWASLCLTVPIALINLFMLALAVDLSVCSIFTQLGDNVQPVIAYGFVWITILALTGLLFLHSPRPTAFGVWIVPLLLFVVALLLCMIPLIGLWRIPGLSGLATGITKAPVQVFAVLVLAVTVGFVAKIIQAYNRQRPSVARLAVIGGTLLCLAMVVRIIFSRSGSSVCNLADCSVLAAFGEVIEALRFLLALAWLAFFGLVFCSHVAGAVAVLRIPDAEGKRQRAALSRWTARFTVSLSGLAVFLTTVLLWKAVAHGTSALLPDNFNYWGVSKTNLLPLFINPDNDNLYAVLLGLLLLVLILDAWSLAPSAWAELFPPTVSENPGKADCESKAMGRWMTNGYSLMRWSGRIMYGAAFLIVPVVLISSGRSIPLISSRPAFDTLSARAEVYAVSEKEIQTLTLLLAGFATSLMALRGRLARIALGLRPALSIILDVDNYFREHPLDSNPRARIAARTLSLIRHLCTWRDSHGGRPYDAIVIVAHSQGSAIITDLLRFIRSESSISGGSSLESYDSDLARLGKDLPLYLFTMGSPLREYYAQLFPDLYEWVRNEGKAGSSTDEVPIPCDASPDPGTLGVTSWTNAFRSGDYIGRQLWIEEDSDSLWRIPVLAEPHCLGDGTSAELGGAVRHDSGNKRREFCIGKGAHSHYWDATASLIAIELDRIIGLAASRAPARQP